jgi:hypothetical protein
LVFSDSSAPPSSRPGGPIADLALLLVGGSALLIALILWFDNAQGGLTGNGIVKSIELRPWIVDPANARLYPSNYLFYPAYGALCRLLDLLGVFAGDPRRQMTILNAVSASFCVCAVYLMVRALTADRAVALIAALFHIACSYVLFLAITNEDIMPSYTLTFASMALASLWFARPTMARVVAVAVLFSLGWLFEWRLMFPTLPALLAALWLCENRPARRVGWIGLFLATVVATAAVAARAWQGHEGAVGPFELLWTGKGVSTGYAGFSWVKVALTWDGTVAYLLGTAITTFDSIPGWDTWRLAGALMILAIAAVALPLLWRARHDPRARALAAVFGVTFVAGVVFNLYSQPQDPQMQINIMGWLTAGWALAVVAARRRWAGRGLAAMAGLTAMLLAYNVWSIAPLRGLDSAWERSVERIGREADLARTVFVLHDFDWTVAYASLHWGLVQPGTEDLGPAPQASPRFKWIGIWTSELRHPGQTGDGHVTALRGEIDRALGLGYQVLIGRLWDMTPAELQLTGGTITDSAKVALLHGMLHKDYSATLAFDDPLAGRFYRLQRAR